MIQKIQMLTIAVVLLFMGYNAQSQDALLWKISGNGLSEPSYLYGTIHIICEKDMVRLDQLEELVKATDQVVLEVDMDAPETAQKMQMGSLNPGMKNIKEELTEKQQDMLNKFLTEKFGANLDQMGIVKPWALSVMISTQGVIECADKTAYETQLLNFAKSNSKEVLGLETIDFQLNMFESMKREDQIKMLTDAVEKKVEYDELLRKLIKTYQNENIDEIHNMFLETSPEMLKYSDLLLYNRNSNWIAKIGEYMKEKSTLFAVGAGHLGGEKGVVALLKKAGYNVEAVKQSRTND
ncbi:MAG: TraB/GumN family protein [Marinifilaceae bacterium]